MAALAGLGVVVSLVLLVHLPVPEQDDQIQLATAVLLAPFPLSALGAFLAPLGLLASSLRARVLGQLKPAQRAEQP